MPVSRLHEASVSCRALDTVRHGFGKFQPANAVVALLRVYGPAIAIDAGAYRLRVTAAKLLGHLETSTILCCQFSMKQKSVSWVA